MGTDAVAEPKLRIHARGISGTLAVPALAYGFDLATLSVDREKSPGMQPAKLWASEHRSKEGAIAIESGEPAQENC